MSEREQAARSVEKEWNLAVVAWQGNDADKRSYSQMERAYWRDRLLDSEVENARLRIANVQMLEALRKADLFLSHSGNQRSIVGNSFQKPSGRWTQFQETKSAVNLAISRAQEGNNA